MNKTILTRTPHPVLIGVLSVAFAAGVYAEVIFSGDQRAREQS